MLETLRLLFFYDNGNNDSDDDEDSGEDKYENYQTIPGCFL